jgi:DNA repair exonuclease SbcCD ATPase subunit
MPERGKAHQGIPIWIAVALACAAIVGAAAVIFWQTRLIAHLQAQLAARAGEKAELERRVDQLTRSQEGGPPVSPKPFAPCSIQPDTSGTAAAQVSASERLAERLRESLAQATAEVERLQASVSDLHRQLETTETENRRLTAGTEELKKSAADAEQTIEMLRAELKANNTRAAQLESVNARLKQEAASSQQISSQMQQNVSDLDGLFRRREMYLNNILRRYHDITEQYRALSGVNASRDHGAGTVGTAEISRIQNSIALAEEDMKQISALSAQVARLEKKLQP